MKHDPTRFKKVKNIENFNMIFMGMHIIGRNIETSTLCPITIQLTSITFGMTSK